MPRRICRLQLRRGGPVDKSVSTSAPFAYGYSGRWLTSTHDREVFFCDGNEDHTVNIVALAGPVVGVRNTAQAVLALDAEGQLYGIDPGAGVHRWQISVGSGGWSRPRAASFAYRWREASRNCS